MLERLGRGLTFVAGSVVGGLALAFLIVALRPDLIRRPDPTRERGRGAVGRTSRRRRRSSPATRPRSIAPPPRSSTSTPTGW